MRSPREEKLAKRCGLSSSSFSPKAPLLSPRSFGTVWQQKIAIKLPLSVLVGKTFRLFVFSFLFGTDWEHLAPGSVSLFIYEMKDLTSLVISYELAPLYLDIGWREGLVNDKVEKGRHLWVTLHVILSQNSTVNYVTSCFVSASHLQGEAAFLWWQKLYCSLLYPLHSPQDLPSRRTQLTFAE